MHIPSAAQLRQLDQETMVSQKITSPQLMERAAQACAGWLMAHYPRDTPFMVLCGAGNNGGDGLALTRILHQHGFAVKAFFLRFHAPSADCLHFINLLSADHPELLEMLQPDTFLTHIPENAVLVDALFGSGLNRKLEGWAAAFVAHINGLPNDVVSIDLPSGLSADVAPEKTDEIVNATFTLSFQFYKRTMFHQEGAEKCGNIPLLDIGLDAAAIAALHPAFFATDEAMMEKIFKPRHPFSHKGTNGTAFIAGGSSDMPGAICLALRAAGRAGAGKVIGLVPQCIHSIVQTLVPEAICQAHGDLRLKDIFSDVGDAVGIGPGMDRESDVELAMENFMEENIRPLVVDADALYLLSENEHWFSMMRHNTILTPHPKEFDRIFGDCENTMQRANLARGMALKHNIIIVLKGRFTFIASPEGTCYYNTSGNAALATAGTGDVLLGMITGLLAQGYEPLHAALLGVWQHGKIAEKICETRSMESMIAWDMVR